MPLPDWKIRNILPGDDAALAGIIRQTLKEFNAAHPNTVYFDDRTDRMYSEFAVSGSVYFVLEIDGKVCGGGGIYPTEALPAGTAELVKLYLLPVARGRGLGKMVLEKCLSAAREMGYQRVYLESMPELTIALPLYERSGFRYIDGPMGNSGHTGCGIWMIKDLD